MHIQLISKTNPGITGTSRYTSTLQAALQQAGHTVQRIPTVPPVGKGLQRLAGHMGFDLQAFFASYPVRAPTGTADVYHIPTQTMATLLLFQRFPAPVVVTVLDIIPYLVRHDPHLNILRHPIDRLFYHLALRSLRRADALIAISHATRQTLIEALGLPAERIQVIYPAIDMTRFRPFKVSPDFYRHYQLDPDTRYVLYVGSDDPRKNLPTLLRAFAHVQQRLDSVQLLKVGKVLFPQEHARLQILMSERTNSGGVRFIPNVPDTDLPAFYNASAAVVLPSFYEGFGYPVVEAMACGTPVIAANRTSLPEVVGHAGCLFEPDSVAALAAALIRLLEDQEQAAQARQAGFERVQRFAPETLAQATLAVYQRTSNQ